MAMFNSNCKRLPEGNAMRQVDSQVLLWQVWSPSASLEEGFACVGEKRDAWAILEQHGTTNMII